ncbi:MAG: hypothetical protein V3W34_05185 [Phycisphaerae bacterium]
MSATEVPAWQIKTMCCWTSTCRGGGLSLDRKLRVEDDIAIFMITGSTQDIDRIVGLERRDD